MQHEEAAPQSGKDWEVIHEEDQSKKIDPRLAGLAKFFDENNSSSNHNRATNKKQSEEPVIPGLHYFLNTL